MGIAKGSSLFWRKFNYDPLYISNLYISNVHSGTWRITFFTYSKSIRTTKYQTYCWLSPTNTRTETTALWQNQFWPKSSGTDKTNGHPDNQSARFNRQQGKGRMTEQEEVKEIGYLQVTVENLPPKFLQYYRMYKRGDLHITDFAKILKCSRTTIYKYIRLAEL